MVGAESAALSASRMSNERSADELRPRNGAGGRNRTVVSALARPHSAVEPHPQNGVLIWNFTVKKLAAFKPNPVSLFVWARITGPFKSKPGIETPS